MKERITLTVDEKLINQVDKTIDGYNVKNRSHAIELLLLRALGSKTLKKALVLAGGKGTRFKPLTDEIPKPMIPLQGKPILQYTIELLKKYNITEIYISVGYMADKIKDYFGDGSRFGVRITYIEEDKPLGTGGPLRLAKPYLTETFVMCNADELKDIDLITMFLFHKENNSKATIALTTVKDPSVYGVARLQGNRIIEFIEKPKDPPSNLINAGLYIMEPEVIALLPDGHCMVEKDLFPKIAEEGRLYGYSFPGQWFDTGNMERYGKALKEWKGFS